MTAELILRKIQERKARHMNDFVGISKANKPSLKEINYLIIRINELDQVIEIIKSCIAAGEDDGK